MKRTTTIKNIVATTTCVAMMASCAQKESAGVPELRTFTDTLSWAYGQNVADALQKGFLAELDADMVLRSARHALDGGKQPLTTEQTIAAIQYVVDRYKQDDFQQVEQQVTSVDQRQHAVIDSLMKANPRIVRHPSGFYYEVLREGKGPKAQYGQRVRFDYRSSLLLTGKPFDQTYGRREPIVHVVGEPMFTGLVQGFQLMSAGSLYRFYFPYQLAFGTSGSGTVPGFTPLIYEVELHELYDN